MNFSAAGQLRLDAVSAAGVCLPETRVWGSRAETGARIGAVGWVSSTLRWGWTPGYDGTAVGSLVQRYYATGAGRFMTADPILCPIRAAARAANPSSANRYLYVWADPINYDDPTGLCGDHRGPTLEVPPDQTGPYPQEGGSETDPWDASSFQLGWASADELGKQKVLDVVSKLWLGAAAIAAAARQAQERAGLVVPKFLKVTRDCYTWSNNNQYVIRHIDYTLYGSDDQEMPGAFISEHLFGDLPLSGPTVTGRMLGIFQDQQSVLSFTSRTLLQRFTATATQGQFPPFFGVPVFVRGFGGDFAFLKVDITKDWVSINGDKGLNPDGSLRMCP